MEAIKITLVLLVALFAGFEATLDEFEFQQPIIACALIGIITGHPFEGLALGGSLQLVALGWMNIGAAVSPDAALCSTASAILVCMKDVSFGVAMAAAMALAVAGLALTVFVRTVAVGVMHGADAAAERGDMRGIDICHLTVLLLQGLRCAIPAALVIAVPVEVVQSVLDSIPEWLTTGLSTAGGFVVVVGYAMVIKMMATPKLWPFFALGFALAALTELNLIAMGIVGVAIALIYMQLSPEFNDRQGGSDRPDAKELTVNDILNDYE